MWKVFSYLFHPVLMPTLGIAIVMACDPNIYLVLDVSQALIPISLVFLCTALLPIFVSWILFMLGMVTSVTKPTDNDRKQLIAFSALFFMLGYYLFHNIPSFGKSISYFMLGINIAMVITLITNLITKVSLHAVGIGGILGTAIGLIYYTRLQMFPLIGIAIAMVCLVGYGRYKLKAHTAFDIYIGNIIGITCQALVFFVGSR